ncbi:hypothetical protein GCM10022416_29970 [Actinomadura keratinilytica]|uniref:Uncharacterized protein n=1 Tax=Actinomadura keratinilytica TaxID=547461 RepID=A0ABP7YV06_9ACTN
MVSTLRVGGRPTRGGAAEHGFTAGSAAFARLREVDVAQPSMRITVDAAMRARDVSRPVPDDGGPADPPNRAASAGGAAEAPDAAKRSRASKNERRRLGKRGGVARKPR